MTTPVATLPDAVRNKLKARMAALSPAQKQLFVQQLAQQGIVLDDGLGNEQVTVDPGKAELATVELPLTPSQAQLWLAEQLNPDTSAYNIAFSWKFTGHLNVDVLRSSLKELVERHQPLRTQFYSVEGRPFQRLLSVTDFNEQCHFEIEQKSVSLQELPSVTKIIALQPFDLNQNVKPLFRACLLDISNSTGEAWVLVLVWHHLIADGWSRGVIVSELAQLYSAGCKQKASNLPEITHHYSDYIEAQQAWLQSKAYCQQLDYWCDTLASSTDLNGSNLPMQRPKTASFEYASRTLSVNLSNSFNEQLHVAARHYQATPFVLLLAAFKLLLFRYTGQSDHCIGIPVGVRQWPNPSSTHGSFNGSSNVSSKASHKASHNESLDFSKLIGFFVNTLALRAQPVNPTQINDWITAVKASLADGFDNQLVPFAEVVKALGIQRMPGRTPVFDFQFQYQNQAYGKQNAETINDAFTGLTLEQQWIELGHTKFDMTWHAIERDSGLLLAIEYRTALYTDAFAQQMADHFVNLIQGLFQASENKIEHCSQLPLLSGRDLKQLSSWQNGNKCWLEIEDSNNNRRWDSFLERVFQHVKDSPDVVAVATSDGFAQLTYQQLWQRSNDFARVFSEILNANNSTGSDRLHEPVIALCLQRTPDLLSAILAAFKVGAAYVPLDPTLPASRLQYIYKNSHAQLIVANSSAHWIDELEDAPRLYIDNTEFEVSDVATVTIHPQQLAYCIYTSGSTGNPKGTLITHAGLMHYLNWCEQRYPLREGKGAAVYTSIGFDATITALLAPLMVGKTTTLAPEQAPINLLADEFSNGHSLLKLTPAHLAALQPLLKATPPEVSGLPKALVIGGEALHQNHIAFWKQHYPQIALINEYGPTETVVGCAYYRANECVDDCIPIGKPITNGRLYVLDSNLNPVPIGVPGELYIGGVGMARGYHQQPKLTAERFLPDPFVSEPSIANGGAVMYRSGDLAQWCSNGDLQYLGRADLQIKLRGFRIEPGEIESLIINNDKVSEVAVALRDKNKLAAYIRLNESIKDCNSWFRSLQQQLQKALPDYMVPTVLELVDQLPLTANGKLDHKALNQLPEIEFLKSNQTEKAPGTDLKNKGLTEQHQILLNAWKTILKKQDIGLEQNFFDLGGDSISAMQIVAAVHQKGYQIQPADLFDNQTIASQALVLQPLPLRQQFDIPTGECPLSPIQWDFFYQVEQGHQPNVNHYNQSLLLDLVDNIQWSLLVKSLDYLVQQHDALRIRFKKSQGHWRGFYTDQSIVVDKLDAGDLSGQELQGIYSSYQQSLSIDSGPLLKALWVQYGNGKSQLALFAHHLITDGVSWRLLLMDLANNYQRLSDKLDLPPLNRPPLNRPPPFSYWTRQLTEQLASFKSEVDYWQSQRLDDINRMCVEQDCLTVQTELDTTQTATLMRLSSASPNVKADNLGMTHGAVALIEELLLTALLQTFCRWRGSNELVVQLENHGRNAFPGDAMDCSRTVGWFTTSYPQRFTLPNSAPEIQLSTIKTTLGNVPNHGTGYGVLRQANLIEPIKAFVSFNHLGNTDFSIAGFVNGLSDNNLPAQRSLQAHLPCPLQALTMIKNGKLQVVWRYDQNTIDSRAMVLISDQFTTNLLSLCSVLTSQSSETQINSAAVESIPLAEKSDSSRNAAKALLTKIKAKQI
ncbi:MAG: amino acid adenylation domain-containing protein [Pseudomonadales bacterium]|nr:amino acid adenylation domain-containing protein [Pseudomonadales bacterium]